MGCPGGHDKDPLNSLSIRNTVFHCIFLGKKAIIITSQSYSKKTLRKMLRKALVNTKQNVLVPTGNPIILLKLTYSIWPPYR